MRFTVSPLFRTLPKAVPKTRSQAPNAPDCRDTNQGLEVGRQWASDMDLRGLRGGRHR